MLASEHRANGMNGGDDAAREIASSSASGPDRGRQALRRRERDALIIDAAVTRRGIGTGAAAAILLAAAVVIRFRTFGNPVVHIDEQFYLLVGGRMWDGALPYVDIFDRKPIGLFLIYALARAMDGSGVPAYQFLALACVWGTALTLFAMARRISSPGAALAVGLLYVGLLDLAGGEGGQAPAFYNLPVAVAAFLVMRLGESRDDPGLRQWGALAMLLIGGALQIKYSAVFEGLYLGIILLALARRAGRPAGTLAADGAIWIACALLPTVTAAAAYAFLGHLPEWIFANATSILERGQELPATVRVRIEVMASLTVPLVLAIVLRRWTGAAPGEPDAVEARRFVDGWAASALLGMVLFGSWFNHYALPLFAPFSVAAAPLGTRRWGRVYLGALLVFSLVWGQRVIRRHEVTRGDARVLADAASAAGRFRGCAFVYDGMPAWYDAVNSCLPTTRPFPAHLQSRNEIGATGIDQGAEVARIMARRPERVMTMEPAYEEENPIPRAALYDVLRMEYVPLYRYSGGSHGFAVYGLKGTLAGTKPLPS